MELEKRSYTAQQLYHLRPEILHHATRRLLLGHAPTDWLVKSNRKWRSIAKQLLKSANGRIDRELARVEGWERGAHVFGHKITRNFATTRAPEQAIPMLDFPAQDNAFATSSELTSDESSLCGDDSLNDDESTDAIEPKGPLSTRGDSHGVSIPDAASSAAATTGRETDTSVYFSATDDQQPIADAEPPKEDKRHLKRYFKRMLKVTGYEKQLFHRKRGEILFIRQFVVQVRETKDALGVREIVKTTVPASIIKDRAREYTAVARWTGKVSAPVAIYLYASSEITGKADHRWSRALKHKILIDAHSKATFFDTLDMSVALWNTRKHYHHVKTSEPRTFYLFTSQSVLVQVSWLFFLLHAAGNVPHPPVNLKIPSINVSLQLINGSIDVDSLPPERSTVSYRELTTPSTSASAFVAEIYRRAIAVLEEINHQTETEKYVICWRTVDFMRILLFDNDFHAMSSHSLLRQHNLEFRKVHTLTTKQEPPPVEGFCWRLTSWRGQSRKQSFATRTYLHSHNHLLFHVSPAKVILPNFNIEGEEHNQEEILEDTADDHIRTYMESLATVSEVNPFPLDENNDIAWAVDGMDSKMAKVRDSAAIFELTRAANNIESSEGCIDLATVTSVRALSNDRMFEISLDNRFNVLIRVAEPAARDAWVTHLQDLAVYWRAKKHDIIAEAKKVYDGNMAQNTNFILRSKLESNFTVPNVASFNIEVPLRTRPIVFSSYLYQKSHKHGFFRKHYAVLTSSCLVLLDCESHCYTAGDTSCQTNTHYSTKRVYDLISTYVYTGTLASEFASVKTDESFDFAQMYNGVPRTYGSNWVIRDREEDCCFILWTEKRRRRSTTRDGLVEGRMVCMARSRIERDLWVNAIQHVITGLSVVRGESELSSKWRSSIEKLHL